MNRLDSMLDRMPAPFGIDRGTVLHDVLSVVDLALRVIDEDRERIQRSHWVDTAPARSDLARLGALFDVTPADWEPTPVYRSRLVATIAAQLRGSVTRQQLDRVLTAILDAAGTALRTRYLELGPQPPGQTRIPITEFPARTQRPSALRGAGALVQPLAQFDADNRGTDPVPLQVLVRGVAGRRTAMPVLVNRTTGQAIGWRGIVAAGQELRVSSTAQGLSAHLRGAGPSGGSLDPGSVTQRLFSCAAFPPVGSGELDDPVVPLMLQRGHNALWFATLARYDDPGLDAAAFGHADVSLHQGRWHDESSPSTFGTSLFWQEPAAALDLWWEERRPATFRVDVPAAVVRRVAGARPDPEADRAALFALLDDTVERLRAAAVAGWVEAVPLRETQLSHDRVRVLAPLREVGSPGHERLEATGARFDVTAREESRWG